MFTKFLSLVDVFHAFLISLKRKFVLGFDVCFVSVARHLDSTPCDAAAKGEVFGGRACACFHGGMDGSVLGVKNETSIRFPLPFAARVFIVCLDMPDFISFVSYHPFDCILRKIYKYQRISSVWLKNAQTLNRHAWRACCWAFWAESCLPKRRQKPWSTPRPLRNKAVQPRAVRIGRILYDFMIAPLRPLDLSP